MARSDILKICVFTILIKCSSAEIIHPGDGIVEKKLSNASGVTTARVKEAEQKEVLQLDDLYAFAVEKTERLALKAEDLEQAKAQNDIAFGSMLPNLSLVVNKFYPFPDHREKLREHRERDRYARAALGIPDPSYTQSGSSTVSLPPSIGSGTRLLLNIPIMSGTTQYSNFKSSKFLIENKELEMRHEAGRLYLEIAQIYFLVLQLEKTLDSRQEIRKNTSEIVKELKYRIQVGKSKKSEMLVASEQLSRIDADIENLKYQLALAKDQMITLTGIEKIKPLQFPDFANSQKPTRSLETALEKTKTRADYRAAQANLKISEYNLIKAWGGHLPNVNLNAYYTLPQPNVPHNKDFTVQLSVNMPLLSAGVVQAQVKNAQSQKRQAELIMNRVSRLAKEEIKKSHNSYFMSVNSLVAYEKSMEMAEKNYQTVKSDYYRKLATSIELMNSLILFHNARMEVTRAKLQKELNWIWAGVSVGEIPKMLEGDTRK